MNDYIVAFFNVCKLPANINLKSGKIKNMGVTQNRDFVGIDFVKSPPHSLLDI